MILSGTTRPRYIITGEAAGEVVVVVTLNSTEINSFRYNKAGFYKYRCSRRRSSSRSTILVVRN